MNDQQFEILNSKVIIRIHDTLCDNAVELLSSVHFKKILDIAINKLDRRESYLLNIFENRSVTEESVGRLIHCLKTLTSSSIDNMNPVEKEFYSHFLKDPPLLNEFVEYVYNFWRHYDRFIICDSVGRDLDKRPYRTFNSTIGQLTQLIRGVYRDIQENITGSHPRIYRQVAAGAELATISVSQNIPFGDPQYEHLNSISMIRQILLNPPLILNPPMNKRKGEFIRVNQNPLNHIEIDSRKWLCYPAKVGPLIILVYIHNKFLDLGLSLCNLFELAVDEELKRKPDAIYIFGAPGEGLNQLASFPTVFYEDIKNDLLVAAVPNRDEFGYFGYLKKMILTLHNVIMMKRGLWPFHGALVRIILKGNVDHTVLFIGDTGAGKSETLEALRELAEEKIQDMIVIADDMGSIKIDTDGSVKGYGTEVGAFLRLDDLKPGYALGQIDRAIIMSANQVNARIILPVTTYDHIIKGHPIDFIFYANNYEPVDDDHRLIERFEQLDNAFRIFKEGTVMSKGTTDSVGVTHSYFANIFGPPQYKDLHEEIALKYFKAFFEKGVYIGQIRTRLGLKGFEQTGPQEAARALLSMLEKKEHC